jgi:O-methyltransferase
MSSDGNRMLLERRWREHPELEHALAQSRTQRGAESAECDARRLYINLLKRAVSGLTAFEPDTAVAMTDGGNIEAAPLAEARMIDREMGLDWPGNAVTMIGLMRLENIQTCIETTLRAGVPGDLIEAGVWRGGATIFMRGVLKAYDVRDRRVWVADSFDGVPPPDPLRYPADAGLAYSDVRYLAVSADEVRRSFARYALLDDQVVFLEGLFSDSLPALRGHQWSVVRLDGDLYESTMDALSNLYDGLSVGGFMIVDDYGAVEACRIAVDEFRAERGISEDLRWIDWSGVYWQRRDS